MLVKKHNTFDGVYWVESKKKSPKLATKNLSPKNKVYEERLVKFEDEEYRIWDPYRSKLGSSIMKKISNMPIKPESKVLYLGAASGTTASHVSDIVGSKGMVYCVEISSRPLRDLLVTCEQRPNMGPILADAQKIEDYRFRVEQVDVIYQDVAHPEQTNIALKNSSAFLKKGGYSFVTLKARSIDVTEEPKVIFKEEIEKMEKEMEIIETKLLSPYAEDHAMVLLQKR